jgi:hypothetical protein
MEIITIKRLFKKESVISLLKIYIPGILFIGLMALYSFLNDFHFNDLSEDAIQTLNAPKYSGLVARVDVVLMCAIAAILLFASRLLSVMQKPGEVKGFLLYGGLLSLLLMLDDFFMLHDWVFREIIPLPENLIFAFYAISGVLFLFYYRKLILKTDYVILLIGFGLLGVSVIVDALIVVGFYWKYSAVLEDGAKFLGMVSWFSYFLKTSYCFTIPDRPDKTGSIF